MHAVRSDSSSSGEGHKVKVAAIVVSEEAGKRAAIVEWATLEYVHDVASVGQGSSEFDVSDMSSYTCKVHDANCLLLSLNNVGCGLADASHSSRLNT